MKTHYTRTAESRLLSNVVKHTAKRIIITGWCILIASVPIVITIIEKTP